MHVLSSKGNFWSTGYVNGLMMYIWETTPRSGYACPIWRRFSQQEKKRVRNARYINSISPGLTGGPNILFCSSMSLSDDITCASSVDILLILQTETSSSTTKSNCPCFLACDASLAQLSLASLYIQEWLSIQDNVYKGFAARARHLDKPPSRLSLRISKAATCT